MSRPFSVIVACDKANGIGKGNDIPWHLPRDMAFFKGMTVGQGKNAVIMGRKTWESLPERFKPLPNRKNMVLSRQGVDVPEAVIVAEDLDAALSSFDGDTDDVFVIGGGQIYEAALAHADCQRLYLTRILKDFDCDVRFPELNGWCCSYSGNIYVWQGTAFSFQVYERH